MPVSLVSHVSRVSLGEANNSEKPQKRFSSHRKLNARVGGDRSLLVAVDLQARAARVPSWTRRSEDSRRRVNCGFALAPVELETLLSVCVSVSASVGEGRAEGRGGRQGFCLFLSFSVLARDGMGWDGMGKVGREKKVKRREEKKEKTKKNQKNSTRIVVVRIRRGLAEGRKA